MIKLLLVGDSHCRGMGNYIRGSNKYITTFSIFDGDKTEQIAELFRAKTEEVRQYHPDVVLLHTGHNDIGWHPVLNVDPTTSRVIIKRTIDLALEIHEVCLRGKLLFRQYTRDRIKKILHCRKNK